MAVRSNHSLTLVRFSGSNIPIDIIHHQLVGSLIYSDNSITITPIAGDPYYITDLYDGFLPVVFQVKKYLIDSVLSFLQIGDWFLDTAGYVDLSGYLATWSSSAGSFGSGFFEPASDFCSADLPNSFAYMYRLNAIGFDSDNYNLILLRSPVPVTGQYLIGGYNKYVKRDVLQPIAVIQAQLFVL